MDEKERKKREEELDRFWDIDALIPPRRASHYQRDTEAVEIVSEIPNSPSQEPKPHFIPPHTPEERPREKKPEEEYFPTDSLIHTVRIFRWRSNYSYYESFLQDARRLQPVTGKECPHIPFFSYVPQYAQMNRSQLEWYLWWRENFRKEIYLSTDYSYLLLYAYEVINLTGVIPKKEGQTLLCRLWLHYRELFHQLDSHLPEWICDYSLLHRLPPPDMFTSPELYAAISHCALKEFYVTASGKSGLIKGILVFGSNYDYHKSKFCTKENEPLYERMILGALEAVFEKGEELDMLLGNKGSEHSRMVRDAYAGALCAYSVKRKIALEYTSFTCSHSLRLLVTDIVKYSENHLRATKGIRARLGIYALPTRVKEILDSYLNTHFPKPKTSAPTPQAEEAAYQRLYDLPRKKLSLGNAKEIELASWQTTEKLIEAFEDTKEESPPPVSPKEQMPITQEAEQIEDAPKASTSPFAPYLEFLSSALTQDAARQREIASKMGKMPDALADEINALAFEELGDILLEEAAQGYEIIEDYRNDVLSLIQGKEEINGKE